MISAHEISKFIKGELIGENISINGAIDLLPGKESYLSFLNNNLSKDYLNQTKSNLIIVSKDIFPGSNKTIIRVSDPKKSFFDVLGKYFYKPNHNCSKGIHSSAIISKKTKIGLNVSIGPNSIISDEVTIEDNVSIGGNSFIGEKTVISRGSIVHPNVAIYNNIVIKDNVVINSGSVIGANGFGIIKSKDNKLNQVPHIGIVEIEDNVIIGAGCTIDRATMSKTIIGKGTKIDGQVHIAHNVKIGKNCIIAGQAAIGGSSEIGDNVVLGGQVGVIDNLVIGDNCVVAAKSAVMKSLDSNSIVSGIPAINHSKKLRLDVLYSRLPELFKKNK